VLKKKEERTEITVANPSKIKAISSSKKKNDKNDSQILAHLLRLGYIPSCYIPDRAIREMREKIRFRKFEVQIRTKLKNRIHSVLAKLGENPKFSDVFGKAGMKYLSELNANGIFRRQIDLCLELMEILSEHIRELDKEIVEEASNNPQAKILMTIPGIGPFLSLLILSEVGDIRRFNSSKELCNYAGLTPSLRSSGERETRGKITREGSGLLRLGLIEAVPHIIRSGGFLSDFYFKVRKRRGANVAKVAVARKLLSWIYHMLKDGLNYEEQEDIAVRWSRRQCW
jgi:transposase